MGDCVGMERIEGDMIIALFWTIFGGTFGGVIGAMAGVKHQEKKIAKGHAIYIKDEEYRAMKVASNKVTIKEKP